MMTVVAIDAQPEAVIRTSKAVSRAMPADLTPRADPHKVPQSGGADRDRTGDPLLAKQVLSQLSYSPILVAYYYQLLELVGLGRVELPTSPLSGVRSSQLS